MRQEIAQYSWHKELGASGAITVKDPGTGRRVRLGLLTFTVDLACTVDVYYGDTNDADHRLFRVKIPADTGLDRDFRGLLVAPDAEIVKIIADGGATITGFVYGDTVLSTMKGI